MKTTPRKYGIIAAAGGVPRFSMVAYTGGAMVLPGFNYPVVVDLAGMLIPSPKRPALRDHKHWKLVGHTEEIINDGETLTAIGLVSGTGPDAQEVRKTSGNGFPWQCSIGASADEVQFIEAGQTVEVNRKTFTGPLYVARKSTLQEISFVPLGADGNTEASIAAALFVKGNAMTFEQWALGYMTLEEFQALSDDAKAALQKVFDAMGTTSDATAEEPADAAPADAPPPVDMPAKAKPASILASIKTAKPVDIAAMVRAEVAKITAAQELAKIRAARPAGGLAFARSSTPAITSQTIEAALCRTLRLPGLEKHFKPEVIEASERQFRTLGLQQIMLLAAVQNGYECMPGQRITHGNIRQVLRAAFTPKIEAAFSPVSLPGIFSTVANKELLTGYMEEDQTWREIGGIRSVSDFKAVTSYRLLDNMEYEEVGSGGEIKHGTLGEESYTRQAKTYAKMLSLTRQDIINDDLGAFDDLRNRLGRGAAQKLNKIFWTEFLSDASTFWTTARTNYITGSTTNLGTDGVGLGLGLKAFRQMTSPSADGTKRIGATPEILLVPPELEVIAQQFFVNMNLGGGTTVANANIYANKYKPIVSVYLSDSNYTGYSTTAWYLLRNPSIAPAVVVSFLNGVEAPTVEDAEADFNVLGVQFRGYHDFGVDQAEYLCGVKSKGAA